MSNTQRPSGFFREEVKGMEYVAFDEILEVVHTRSPIMDGAMMKEGMIRSCAPASLFPEQLLISRHRVNVTCRSVPCHRTVYTTCPWASRLWLGHPVLGEVQAEILVAVKEGRRVVCCSLILKEDAWPEFVPML